MSEAQTVESFAALLAQADQPEQPPEADSGPDAQQASEEGAPDAAAESDAPAVDGAEDEAGQPEQAEKSDSERVVEWQTASGEKIQATEAELKAGYLRQQDYTQKTQAIAEDRKRAQAEIVQQAQVVQALAQNLGEYQAVEHQLQQYKRIDWSAWSAADPSAASAAYIQYQELTRTADAKRGEVMAAKQRFDSEQTQAFEAGVQAATQRLTEKVKGITRAEVLQTFESIQKLGGDTKTIDAVRSNPALAEMAIYAQRWLDLQGKKPSAATAVKGLPPPTTKARPAAAPSNQGERVIKALKSKTSFSTNEFAQMLNATR